MDLWSYIVFYLLSVWTGPKVVDYDSYLRKYCSGTWNMRKYSWSLVWSLLVIAAILCLFATLLVMVYVIHRQRTLAMTGRAHFNVKLHFLFHHLITMTPSYVLERVLCNTSVFPLQKILVSCCMESYRWRKGCKRHSSMAGQHSGKLLIFSLDYTPLSRA